MNCVFMIGGLYSIYKQNSLEFSVEIPVLELILISCFYIGHQVSVFKRAQVSVCLTGSWEVFRKIETHSRAHGSCHVFDLWGVTSFVHLNPLVKKNVFGSNSNMKKNLEFMLNEIKVVIQNLSIDLFLNCPLLKVGSLSFLSMFKIVKKKKKIQIVNMQGDCLHLAQIKIHFKET